MLLSDALVIARKRGRGVKRRHWSWRHVVIAWDDLWVREMGTTENGWGWKDPRTWAPTLGELLANDWETCRP